MGRYILLFVVFVSVVNHELRAQAGAAAASKTQQSKKRASVKKNRPALTPTKTAAAGWSGAERSSFMEECKANADMQTDSATRYCSCMLQKIEKLYPDHINAQALTTEKATELAVECLKMQMPDSIGWSKKNRDDFRLQCQQSAEKNISKQKAKLYCACMQTKLEKEYPNAKDMLSLSEELVNKLAAECNR